MKESNSEMIWLEMETENYEQMASKFVWEICRESVLLDLLSLIEYVE